MSNESPPTLGQDEPAWDYFEELGDAVNYHRNCNCEQCQESIKNLEPLGVDRLDFAQHFYKMCKTGSRPDVLLRARMEDWNEQQLREVLGTN